MDKKKGTTVNRTIKELPVEYRPREKCLIQGPSELTDSELLAIILRTGSREKNVIELSNDVIRTLSQIKRIKPGIGALRYATFDDLWSIKGIGQTKSIEIMVLKEISERINKQQRDITVKITSPQMAANIFMDEMRNLDVEKFYVLGLNPKKEISYVDIISQGTINATLVHPREVFSQAVSRRVHSVMLLHNHPSGDVLPSQEDRFLTQRLVEAGEILDIKVIDHIIIGDGIFYSFLEEGDL